MQRLTWTAGWLVLAIWVVGCGTSLPTWHPAEKTDLADEQWISGPTCSVRAGKRAILEVPVWWGEGFRPPEGTLYVLEIDYQDTATEPVIVSSHAGVAPYKGMSELHRFGGFADGVWKTAHVPLSWDLICRKNGGDTTELGIQADRNLPVRSIRVTRAGPGAAERYRRETRAWVARVQAGKRRAASPGPTQKPRLSEPLKDKPIIPYPCDWQVPLYPAAAPQAGQAGAAVTVRMARNEYQPATFAVYANGHDLRDVEYEVTSLQGPAGTLMCELVLRTAEYSAVQAEADYGKPDSGQYKLYPQRLWPQYKVDIPAGRSHLFWITIQTLGSSSRPGVYTGSIRIKAHAGNDADGNPATAELPLRVEVLPVTLLSTAEAGVALSNCTTGLPTLQEVRTMVEHNHTGVDIWFAGVQPGMKVIDGKLELDFTYLDDWMVRAREIGMTHVVWFLGGDPKGFPDTMNLERDLARASAQTPAERDRLRREFLDQLNRNPGKVPPGIRDLYVAWVRQTVTHARKAGWPELILQPFDEPAKWTQNQKADNPFHPVIGSGPWIKPHFKDSCALIRQGDAKVKIGLEAHRVEPCLVFLDDVDVFCTNRAWQVEDLAERLAEHGVEFWQYANCDDQAPAHRMRYGYGFYFGGYGSVGNLVWAYNWWNRFDTSGRNNWGSAWYTPVGTVFAPSLVGLREGLDDRRWLASCRNLGADDPAVESCLARIGEEAIASRAETPYTSYNEVDDVSKLHRWRNEVIETVLTVIGRTSHRPAR